MWENIFANWQAALFWVAVGILFGWPIKHLYFWVAGKKQKREFEVLRNLDNLTLRFLENANPGDVSVRRNERGEPIGLYIVCKPQASAIAGVSVNATVRRQGKDVPQ
jgi:hypothetical protein